MALKCVKLKFGLVFPKTNRENPVTKRYFLCKTVVEQAKNGKNGMSHGRVLQGKAK